MGAFYELVLKRMWAQFGTLISTKYLGIREDMSFEEVLTRLFFGMQAYLLTEGVCSRRITVEEICVIITAVYEEVGDQDDIPAFEKELPARIHENAMKMFKHPVRCGLQLPIRGETSAVAHFHLDRVSDDLPCLTNASKLLVIEATFAYCAGMLCKDLESLRKEVADRLELFNIKLHNVYLVVVDLEGLIHMRLSEFEAEKARGGADVQG